MKNPAILGKYPKFAGFIIRKAVSVNANQIVMISLVFALMISSILAMA